MGVISFLIPDLDRLCSYSAETCHFVGFDGVPWTSTARLDGNCLHVETSDDDSAKFLVPWQVEGIGPITLSTGTLKQRPTPFHLPVELARGTLHRLRNFLAAHRPIGFSPNAELRKQLTAATNHFVQAAISQADASVAASAAQHSIDHACRGIQIAVESFTQFRWAGTTPLPKVWIAYEMQNEFVDDPRATVASLPVSWKSVESTTDDFQWLEIDTLFRQSDERRLRSLCGPLLDLRPHALPEWVYLWQDDIGALESFVCRYVAEVVRRYSDRVHIWNCGVALSTGVGLNLSEEDRLRLTVRAIETIRAHDSSTPVLISIDEPWGEYLVEEELDLSPFQFADMLARAEIGVSAFGLRFNIGKSCRSTLSRDGLDFGSLVDRWSTLGMPLVLMFDSESDVECLTAATKPVISFLRTKPAVQGIVFGDRLRQLNSKQ